MWTIIDSPAGPIRIIAHDGAITAVEFTADPPDDATAPLVDAGGRRPGRGASGRRPGRRRPAAARGEPAAVGVLRAGPQGVRPAAASPRHRRSSSGCGRSCSASATAQTASYGELADRLGMARGAARAVGAANGRNPIGIVIPCHRVVGAEGIAQRLRRRRGAQAAAAAAGAVRAGLRPHRRSRVRRETFAWAMRRIASRTGSSSRVPTTTCLGRRHVAPRRRRPPRARRSRCAASA